MSDDARGHREIDHTADLGFEVWAPDRASLFAEAICGLCDLCFERELVRPNARRRVEVAAVTDEELLVKWLQECYLQLEADVWLTAFAEDVEVSEGRVVGDLVGEPYDPARHTLHTEIKAVTYHGLAVRRQPDGAWRATVIVDV